MSAHGPSNPDTVRAWLDHARQCLQNATLTTSDESGLAGVDSDAVLDAEVLLTHTLDLSRTALYAWPEAPITPTQRRALDARLTRRLQGEPLAYILGQREFWSLPLEVNPAVLVPRPDTELLVECALHALHTRTSACVIDAGTGSGAVAIAIASEHGARLIASDLSAAALAQARDNARRLVPERIEFVQCHWLSAFADDTASVIVSNPPYLRADDPHLETPALRAEPQAALVSGDDGLDAIRCLLQDAPRVGRRGARLLLEHGYQQGAEVRTLMQLSGFAEIETHRDLAGHERVTEGVLP